MNFDFSEEQQALRDQTRRLLSDNRAGRLRAIVDHGEVQDRRLWDQVAEMGLCAAAIPEESGGLGLGALELCVVAEELGRALAPIPFASSVFYATEALKLANDVVAADWLPRLADGSVIGTVGLVEGIGTWDSFPGTRVDAGKLTGSVFPVTDGMLADIAVVAAVSEEDGDGYGFWLVELDQPGVSRQPMSVMDRLRSHARIDFTGAPARRIGAPGKGAEFATRLMDIAAVLTAFEQLGGAQAQLEVCIDYAKLRRAFGALIGSNQAVKHKLADIYTKIELARGHCYFGAWALSTQSSQLPLAAAGARLAATDAFCFAAEEAIELHGAIGFTWENDCHLYYRRARSLAVGLGNRTRWSERLVAALASRTDLDGKG